MLFLLALAALTAVAVVWAVLADCTPLGDWSARVLGGGR